MADQLTSDELRQVLADWISPYPPKQRRKIAGLFEAVIARAEAAEAEAEDAILAASDAAQREENAMHALSHFRARVAELEAQVASHRRDYNNLYDDYHEMRHKLADIGAMLRAARQRVAELESQLAAQQWRPVTEDWPPYNERVIIGYAGGYGGGWSAFARRVRTDNRDGDDWLMDDDTTLAFESAVVAMQRPLPPAPQETE
jgi:hypothetical protein